MSRTAWFVAGAGAGVYAALRARRVAESLTPEGLQDRLAGLRLGAVLFTAEVREGMAEKETELRSRVDLRHRDLRAVHDGPTARPSLSAAPAPPTPSSPAFPTSPAAPAARASGDRPDVPDGPLEDPH